jgi:hypothetical protein
MQIGYPQKMRRRKEQYHLPFVEAHFSLYMYFLVDADGNKSLYLVFVGVVFSQHLVLLLEQLGQHLGLLLDQLGQQHLDFFLGQQDSSILTAFRTAVSI